MIKIKNEKKYLDEIYKLETEIFKESAYSYEEIEKISTNERYQIFLFLEETIKGYIIIYDSYDVYEIMKIAVKMDVRNKKIGTKILDYIKSKLDKPILLEVREGNKTAREFYKKNGFLEYGKRKNYYRDNENAILMSYNN